MTYPSIAMQIDSVLNFELPHPLCYLLLLIGMIGCSVVRLDHPTQLPSNAEQRTRVVEAAIKFDGSPYKYGGYTARGFDCSGLVYISFDKAGIQLPRTSAQQFRVGKPKALSEVRKGDLLFYTQKGKINHVALVTKVQRSAIWVIHSTTSRGVIQENILISNYWHKRFKGARDVIDSN